MIHVRVDGPLRQDDVRPRARDHTPESVRGITVHHRRAVDLAREKRLGAEDLARRFALRRANRRRLVMGFAGDARLAAREVNDRDGMPGGGVARQAFRRIRIRDRPGWPPTQTTLNRREEAVCAAAIAGSARMSRRDGFMHYAFASSPACLWIFRIASAICSIDLRGASSIVCVNQTASSQRRSFAGQRLRSSHAAISFAGIDALISPRVQRVLQERLRVERAVPARSPERPPPPAPSGTPRAEVRRTAARRSGTCRGDRRCACTPRTSAPARCPESPSASTSGTRVLRARLRLLLRCGSSAPAAAPPETPSCAGCSRSRCT